jgi:hypothetical protein
VPLENNNLINDNDPETRLENDNSKDLKLMDETNIIEDTAEERMNLNDNCEKDTRVVTDGEQLADGIVELAKKEEYIDEP